MLCSKCQGEIQDSAKFCRHCGSQQEAPSTPPTPVPPVEVTPVPPVEATPVPPVEATPVPPVEATVTPPVGEGVAQAASQVAQVASATAAQAKEKATATFQTVKNSQVMEDIKSGKAVDSVKSLSKTKPELLAGVVVAVLLVVAVVGTSLFGGTSGKVGSALSSTSKQLKSELISLRNDLPVYDFFKNYKKDNYTIEFEPSYNRDTSYLLELDYGKKQAILEYDDYYNGAGTLTVSEAHTTFLHEDTDELMGVGNKSFGVEFNDSKYSNYDMVDSFVFNPFVYDFDSVEVMYDLWLEAAGELFSVASVEKVASTNLRINGNREEVDSYELTFPADKMEQFLKDLVSDILNHKTLYPQIEQYYLMQYFNLNQSNAQSWADELREDLEDHWYDWVEDFVDDYEDARDQYITVQLYKGKVVRIATAGKDSENKSISFSSTQNLLESVSLSVGGYEMTYSFQRDGSSMTWKSSSSTGSSNKVVYDYEDRSENVQITRGSSTSKATLNSTKDDILTIEYTNGDVLKIEKNQLSSQWFKEETVYEPVFELKQSESFCYAVNILRRSEPVYKMWYAVSNHSTQHLNRYLYY